MKNFLLVSLFFAVVGLLATPANAQERSNDSSRPSPNAMVSQTIGTTVVTITYGRPSLRGRDMSGLAPSGRVWRTGANESTAITFSNDVMFGGQEVAAGTYSLYTIPGESEWTLIINEKLSWGTAYDEAMDVVRVPSAVVKNNAPMAESFTIFFDTLSDTKAHLNLHWGTTLVAVPITTE
ncbi:DUF2911 domain-containing protein [Balneola sp. MJW-20]|uniref:DUF2911 domain-containing protein n=1 Tax=Gracilimonas aurantiaca TaxID=3234185 RepID=UPI003466A671